MAAMFPVNGISNSFGKSGPDSLAKHSLHVGLRFEKGNAADLVHKVRSMIENPERLRQMGIRAHELYEGTYSPQSNYTRLMEIYERVLLASRQSRPEQSMPNMAAISRPRSVQSSDQ